MEIISLVEFEAELEAANKELEELMSRLDEVENKEEFVCRSEDYFKTG